MNGLASESPQNESITPLADGEKREIPSQDYELGRYTIEVERATIGASVTFFGDKETLERLHDFIAPPDLTEETPNRETRQDLHTAVSSVAKVYYPKPSGRTNQPDEHRLLIASNYSDTKTFIEAVIKPMANLKVIPPEVESWLS